MGLHSFLEYLRPAEEPLAASEEAGCLLYGCTVSVRSVRQGPRGRGRRVGGTAQGVSGPPPGEHPACLRVGETELGHGGAWGL